MYQTWKGRGLQRSPLVGQVTVTIDDQEYVLDKDEVEEMDGNKSSQAKVK